MRIGRTIIDTDNMTVEELGAIITELRAIRARKVQAKNFKERIENLVEEARQEGFAFIDKDFGNVIQGKDVVLYDERA